MFNMRYGYANWIVYIQHFRYSICSLPCFVSWIASGCILWLFVFDAIMIRRDWEYGASVELNRTARKYLNTVFDSRRESKKTEERMRVREKERVSEREKRSKASKKRHNRNETLATENLLMWDSICLWLIALIIIIANLWIKIIHINSMISIFIRILHKSSLFPEETDGTFFKALVSLFKNNCSFMNNNNPISTHTQNNFDICSHSFIRIITSLY